MAQQNINLKSKLSSVTDLCDLTLPVPGLQVILQPFPHTKLLRKALVSAGKKPHTHTHTKGLLLHLPPFGSLGCPSPQLTLPRGQDQHQEWERASIPVPGWQCSLAHTAVWHSHTLLPTWKFSQEQERIKERNS